MQDNKRPQENERTVRDALHSRAFKNGAYASVLCAVMLALVVALNLFVGALPAKYLRYDMTENKLYSLSQETEDLCAALTQDVTFYYLGRTGQEDAAVTELLDKYKDASSHIQVRTPRWAVSSRCAVNATVWWTQETCTPIRPTTRLIPMIRNLTGREP